MKLDNQKNRRVQRRIAMLLKRGIPLASILSSLMLTGCDDLLPGRTAGSIPSDRGKNDPQMLGNAGDVPPPAPDEATPNEAGQPSGDGEEWEGLAGNISFDEIKPEAENQGKADGGKGKDVCSPAEEDGDPFPLAGKPVPPKE